MGNDGKSMEGLWKGFLLDRNITNRRKDKMNDGRKKLYDDTEISGSYDNTIKSNSSIDSDSEMSDILGLSEYEKRILGIGPKTDIWNTYDCNIEVKLNDYDSGSYIDETILCRVLRSAQGP